MKILVINGPNLQLLGDREVEVYGKLTLKDLDKYVEDVAKDLGLPVKVVQTNYESEIVEFIGNAKSDGFKGIIINPAAYTHTSVAIRDAIEGCKLPVIEVHISNVDAREDFRKQSLTAPVCVGKISGLGKFSYGAALWAIKQLG